MTAAAPGLLVVDEGAVRILTIDRPDRRNAVDSLTLVALRNVLVASDADPEVRVLVLTGTGDRAFSAGIDLHEPEPDGDAAEVRRWRGRLAEVFLAADRLSTPLVCRVNGPALGGGVGLAAMGDLALATASAWFCLPEIDVARWPLAVGAVLLRRMSRQAVIDMAMTGRRVDAAEALALGLVQRVVADDRLDQAVAELTSLLASKAPAAMATGLPLTRRMSGLGLEESCALSVQVLEAMLATDEGRLGTEAFRAGRRAGADGMVRGGGDAERTQ